MILYHAVSSYQLLEIILYQITKNKNKSAILILPDFIVEKYPQYKILEELQIFKKVYLFPYLHIQHSNEKKIVEDVEKAYKKYIPYEIENFDDIYIAGAHFYFSLYVIKKNCEFNFFEDAAGMLSRSDELYMNLHTKFPLHAEIAKKYSLFSGTGQCIKRIYCLKRLQSINVSGEIYKDFDVEDTLARLSIFKRKKILDFFGVQRYRTQANAILLTQHFANLGIMSEEEQECLYQKVISILNKRELLIIKRHPDDKIDYKKIAPDVEIIQEIFPAELLPYIFKGRKRPKVIYTFNSTGIGNLSKKFKIVILEERYEK